MKPIYQERFPEDYESDRRWLCRRTGLAEISDELLAVAQLLLSEAQHSTDTFQLKRQAHIRGPDYGTFP